MLKRAILILCLFLSLAVHAQFKTAELLRAGSLALDHQNYVVAIQYSNMAISCKAYMYEPWYMRAIAKYYLNDFTGAEADCTEAIQLNPYVWGLYELRSVCRMNMDDFEGAKADIERGLHEAPMNRNFYFNHALCQLKLKKYELANHELDSVLTRWPDLTDAYSLKADLYLQEKDTTEATRWLDKALVKNSYDARLWMIRGRLHLIRQEWKGADEAFSKSIRIKPKVVNNYVYRAVARENLNRLRDAMADYDIALDLDPNNFIAHYDRGLLRLRLGDHNRAITDFDFVLNLEPNHIQALYNRARLLDMTGDYRAAIRDYSRVIDEFPNFWVGLMARARCYRHLGQVSKAELDEFRVFKAQQEKHYGIQPRWSKNKIRQVRKMSEIDVEKYDQLVIADEEQVASKYNNPYQGEVQKRKVDIKLMPMYMLSFLPYQNGVQSYQVTLPDVETFNNQQKPLHLINVTCNPKPLNVEQSKDFFEVIDDLSERIGNSKSVSSVWGLLLQRAVAYSAVQNYDAAVNDLTTCLQIDSTSAIVFWQRAVCQVQMDALDASQGVDAQLRAARVKEDLARAQNLDSQNPYIYYDCANIFAARSDYEEAVKNYTIALAINPNIAEAYYNRGLVRIFAGCKAEGIKDLSKAGELGIYDAYSLMRQYRDK